MVAGVFEGVSAKGRDGSVLVVRYYALGDIVLSLPFVRALRETVHEARLDFLCLDRFAGALDGVDEIDEVLAMDGSLAGRARAVAKLRKRRYDLAVDLLSSPGSALITFMSGARVRIGMDTGRNNWCYHRVLPRKMMRDGRQAVSYTMDANISLARELGCDVPDPFEEMGSDAREKRYHIGFPAAGRHGAWARELLGRRGESGFAGIVAAAKYSSKAWPEEKFTELCRLLLDGMGLTPVILWGPGEEETATRIARSDSRILLPPATGIGRLGALIAEMEVVVGIDSGPKHLAVLSGVPTVTLFGPTDPRVWDPMTPMHKAVFSDVECRPCSGLDCADRKCLDQISPEEVALEVKNVLARPGRERPGYGEGEID